MEEGVHRQRLLVELPPALKRDCSGVVHRLLKELKWAGGKEEGDVDSCDVGREWKYWL